LECGQQRFLEAQNKNRISLIARAGVLARGTEKL